MMTNDSADGYDLLYGGYDGGSNWYGDTWSYVNGAWTQQHPSFGSPQARVWGAMTYDAKDGYVLLFGGWNKSIQPLNDTWKYSKGEWTLLHPTVSPSPRFEAQMAYDALDGYVLLFGGCDVAPSGYCSDDFADTWAYAGGIWTQLNLTASPPAGFAGSMAYDWASQSVIYFSGVNTTSLLPTSWTFHAGNWNLLSGGAQPAPRYLALIAYDPSLGGTIVTRGRGGPGDYLDVWLYKGGGWGELSSTSPQPGLPFGFLAWDDRGGGLVEVPGLQPLTWAYAVPPSVTERSSSSVTDVGLAVAFSASIVGGLGPFSVGWTWGDGTTATGVNASHRYAAAGQETVGVSVSDLVGEIASASLGVAVNAAPTLAVIGVVNETDVGVGLSLGATGGGGTPPYNYTWNPGTGGYLYGALVGVAFDAPGDHAISITFADSAGFNSTQSYPISVFARPSSSVVTNATNAATGDQVRLQVSVTGGVGPFATTWDFGDGATGSGSTVTHEFGSSGTYVITETTVDAAGVSSNGTYTLNVTGTQGLSTATLEILAGLGIVAAAAAIVLVVRRRRSK